MKSFVISVTLLAVFFLAPVQGNDGVEKDYLRLKRHAGHYGGRPTYGGYQNVGGYQQQQQPHQQPQQQPQQQPHYRYSNQRMQHQYGGEPSGYQQPNYNQGYGQMRSFSYQQHQPAQNYYQPPASGYQGYNSFMPNHYQQYDYQMAG